MKMTFFVNTGPVAYTLITDTTVICKSPVDAIEFMKTKGYQADVVNAFEDYCTNFTEFNSSMFKEKSNSV